MFHWLTLVSPLLLSEGYRLPFMDGPPPPSSLPNNKSALDPAVRDFVECELEEHLHFGWISEVAEAGAHCILPLSAARRSDGRLRLVVDTSRQVNPHLEVKKVKLDGLSEQVQMVSPGC